MKFLKTKKCYFEHESQVFVSAVHPDMMYNHDNWDFICYFGGQFVLQFWKGKTKNRSYHGAHLKSAYPNCVKTTVWQILLGNALQTLRMPLFEKWALTIFLFTSGADLDFLSVITDVELGVSYNAEISV